jgi:hypothetical protein
MTCPRKYCLIDTCTPAPADDTEPSGETVVDTEPSDDEPADQPFPTYQSKQPDQPPSVASQVECIAGNTFMYFCVLTLISAALQLTLSSDSIVWIITIILGAATGISLVAAAVAEQVIDRHTPARKEATPRRELISDPEPTDPEPTYEP